MRVDIWWLGSSLLFGMAAAIVATLLFWLRVPPWTPTLPYLLPATSFALWFGLWRIFCPAGFPNKLGGAFVGILVGIFSPLLTVILIEWIERLSHQDGLALILYMFICLQFIPILVPLGVLQGIAFAHGEMQAGITA